MEKRFKWREINRAELPSASGVYAWYYGNEIGKFDVNKAIDYLRGEAGNGEKRSFLSEFLQNKVFQFYKEAPYAAIIQGKLKPRYEGEMNHIQTVSDDVVTRILERPELLEEIRKQFEDVSYGFSSPLYIGMSGDLSTRLLTHKNLIEKYSSAGIPKLSSEDDERDHNFAARVVSRGFVETELFVVVRETSSSDSVYSVMENILNRINYPILGRN